MAESTLAEAICWHYICPECRRFTSITGEGAIRRHRTMKDGPICKGTGRPPWAPAAARVAEHG